MFLNILFSVLFLIGGFGLIATIIVVFQNWKTLPLYLFWMSIRWDKAFMSLVLFLGAGAYLFD